jgi:hypothetical protein
MERSQEELQWVTSRLHLVCERFQMPNNHPGLDRASLARLGVELQAAHHRSEKEPLTEGQRDLLLQWAVREALEAAQHEALGASEPKHAPSAPVLPLDPPQSPQSIETAPKADDPGGDPVLLLLYSPEQGGWHTGFWRDGRWRTHLGAEVELRPTHWLPPMRGPDTA